jgi:hypothetical protein
MVARRPKDQSEVHHATTPFLDRRRRPADRHRFCHASIRKFRFSVLIVHSRVMTMRRRLFWFVVAGLLSAFAFAAPALANFPLEVGPLRQIQP